MRQFTNPCVLAACAVLIGCGKGEQGQKTDTAASAAAAPAAAQGPQTGEQLYQRCATCHQPTGLGSPGVYPPLAGSEYANAKNVEVPIRIVTHGLQGPVTVKGQQFNGVMPQYGTGVEMTNEEVAAVLTYVRSSFGNASSPVTADDVAKVKSGNVPAGPMTAEALAPLMK